MHETVTNRPGPVNKSSKNQSGVKRYYREA